MHGPSRNTFKASIKIAAAGLLLLGLSCAAPSTYNPADPASREFFETILLRCVLGPDRCYPLAPQGMAGNAASCVLTDAGNVRCFGSNGGGQLGYNDILKVGDGTRAIIDVGDIPLGGTATQISTEGGKACALLTTGAVRCWGKANDGELGYNDILDVGDGNAGRAITDMGDVPIGGTAIQIASGSTHACALLQTGNIRCWGGNASGQLGYNDTVNVGDGTAGRAITDLGDVPVGGTVIKVTLGSSFTCALLSTGGVRCWGSGALGQLGYNDALNVGDGTASRAIVDMGDVPIGETALDIFAGDTHACALLVGGRIRCWGEGAAGRLGHNSVANIGDGTAGQSIIDTGDVSLNGYVTSMSLGANFSCALFSDKTLRCWGNGSNGRLGNNATANVGDGVGLSIADAGTVPVGFEVLQVSAGQTACALSYTGRLRCWGNNGQGQLGQNDTLSIGDGTAGRSIIDLGDVPVGVALPIAAPR